MYLFGSSIPHARKSTVALLILTCPSCRHDERVLDDAIGTTRQCPKCGDSFIVDMSMVYRPRVQVPVQAQPFPVPVKRRSPGLLPLILIPAGMIILAATSMISVHIAAVMKRPVVSVQPTHSQPKPEPETQVVESTPIATTPGPTLVPRNEPATIVYRIPVDKRIEIYQATTLAVFVAIARSDEDKNLSKNDSMAYFKSLLNEYKIKLCIHYGITMKEMSLIYLEGKANDWPMPDKNQLDR